MDADRIEEEKKGNSSDEEARLENFFDLNYSEKDEELTIEEMEGNISPPDPIEEMIGTKRKCIIMDGTTGYVSLSVAWTIMEVDSEKKRDEPLKLGDGPFHMGTNSYKTHLWRTWEYKWRQYQNIIKRYCIARGLNRIYKTTKP